jgi:hypothetical protein
MVLFSHFSSEEGAIFALLVVLPPEGWRALTGLAFDVLLDKGEYISVKVIGVEDLKGENPFIRNVMREGIKIA